MARAKSDNAGRLSPVSRREVTRPLPKEAENSATQPLVPAKPRTLIAVASLRERLRAATLDVGVLLFCYGGMLALFLALGGRIAWGRFEATITAATLVLFYAQYFALFTVFGGSTPGMMFTGLRVVRFDRGIPTSKQMIWRSLGHLAAVSTCFLAYAWVFYDEDRLTWQDCLSGTYITSNQKLAVNQAADQSPSRQAQLFS